MLVVAVGRIARRPEAALFDRYNERLRPGLRVIECAEGRGSAVEIKRREAAGLLAAIPDRSMLVALDPGGLAFLNADDPRVAPDSVALAGQVTRWRESGRDLCFAIGGAEGLDASVIGRADTVLSLGQLTWPHFLVRVMLAEQLFRAQSIAAGHPYHRAGRPGNG